MIASRVHRDYRLFAPNTSTPEVVPDRVISHRRLKQSRKTPLFCHMPEDFLPFYFTGQFVSSGTINPE
jgi:hypothetical protein